MLNDIIDHYSPDVILLQEHWLTPGNLYKFDVNFVDYFSFGQSAMSNCTESGMLRGRPFGGVITLIKISLRKITRLIHCSDRCVIVKIVDCLFSNVYLPCVTVYCRIRHQDRYYSSVLGRQEVHCSDFGVTDGGTKLSWNILFRLAFLLFIHRNVN